MTTYKECDACEDNEGPDVNGSGCSSACPVLWGFGPPPDCWWPDTPECLYHDRAGRCLWRVYEEGVEAIDCDPPIYEAIAGSDNVQVTTTTDAFNDVQFEIAVSKTTFKGSGIASVTQTPDPLNAFNQCVEVHVSPPEPIEIPDPCAAETLSKATCNTDILVCEGGKQKRMSISCATKTERYSSVADGLVNTVTGQNFIVGCAVYQNCNCGTSAVLVNHTELQIKNFGWIHTHEFAPGDVVGDEFTKTFCVSQFGLPDCVNTVAIKIEITFCHRLQGDFDDQNVTWSLVGNAGTGHFARSARFCSQSVRDLSDSVVNTAWVTTDANGCFTLTSGIQGDVGFEYERFHPEDFASIRYGLQGAGVVLRGDGEWARVGECA